MIETILAGLTAGAVHVLAGPDHLAAVAPLAASRSGRPWRVGLSWGLGHAGGVLLVGLAAILLRELLRLERLSEWSETLVGLMLIAIGGWGIRQATRQRVHSHEHLHDGVPHVHLHVHEAAHHHEGHHAHARTTGTALGVGVMHGLAGSAHFLGVLPALALPTRTAAVTYVGFFGVGTVVAMTGFAEIIGRLAARSSTSGTRAYRALLGVLGLAAIAVGIVWIVP